MMKLRRSTAPVVLVLALLVTGCASFRSRHRSTANVGAPSIAETKVAADHLIDIGDLLREQGQHAQAAEMYRLALERDPGNALAKKALNKLPIAFRSAVDSAGSKGRASIRETAPQHNGPSVPRRLPQAPPVQVDTPAASPLTVPGELLDTPTENTLQHFKAASALPKTLVQPNPDFRDEHVMQIIPASKGGTQRSRELHYDVTRPPPRSSQPPRSANRKKPIHTSLRLPPTQRPQSVRMASATQAKDDVRSVLSELTGYADSPQDHVTGIVARLGHSSSYVRVLSIYLLGRAGLQAHGQTGQLRDMLNSESHGPTRMRIAEALVRIGAEGEAPRAAIAEGLQSPDSATRWEAVCIAGVMNDHLHRDGVLAGLLARLDDSEQRIREMAALVAGDFQQDRVRVISTLEAAGGRPSSNPEFHKAVAITLAALRSYRGPVPALRPPEAKTFSAAKSQDASQAGPMLSK